MVENAEREGQLCQFLVKFWTVTGGVFVDEDVSALGQMAGSLVSTGANIYGMKAPAQSTGGQ